LFDSTAVGKAKALEYKNESVNFFDGSSNAYFNEMPSSSIFVPSLVHMPSRCTNTIYLWMSAIQEHTPLW